MPESMLRGRVVVRWSLVVLGLVLLGLSGCGDPESDEQRIANNLDAMTEALEAGEVGRFMDYIAEDFGSADGQLDYDLLQMMVRRERLARSSISIQRIGTDIEVFDGGRATAQFQALGLGGSGWLPDEGEWWRVDTGWRLDGDDWMLISADWSRGVGPG